MPLRILIAPDKFKGSLTAPQAVRAISRGLKKELPTARLEEIPLSDGGEGFVDGMVAATEGKKVRLRKIHDARMRLQPSYYGWLGNTEEKTAVIEMNAAAGIAQLPEDLRDPSRTSTFGVGELMKHAIERGAQHIIVGLGGSATNDAGAGMAQALGHRLLDTKGKELPPGGLALSRLGNFIPSSLQLPRITVACDVTNPLCGPDGASAIFGPQKGAKPSMVKKLDAALSHFAESIHPRNAKRKGAGAAGGTAYGLITFCKARLTSGFDVLANALDLESHVRQANLIITGEGSFDAQTQKGKVIDRLGRIAQKHRKPLLVLAGNVDRSNRLPFPAFSLVPGPRPLSACVENAESWLESSAQHAARLIRQTQSLGL